MKAVIQRCLNAQVSVDGEVVSKIGQGACIFVGISSKDDVQDIEFMVNKLLSLQMFDDANGLKWKKSIIDNDFELLCISQFTLYNIWKGYQTVVYNEMPSENSKDLYEKFIQLLKDKYNPNKIKDGVFGASMQVSLQDDGPVTYIRTKIATPNRR